MKIIHKHFNRCYSPGKTEVEECLRLLDESNWNLEQAVQLSFNPFSASPPENVQSSAVIFEPNRDQPGDTNVVNDTININSNISNSNNVRQRVLTSYQSTGVDLTNPNFIGPRFSNSSGPVINRNNGSLTQILVGHIWNLVLWPVSITYRLLSSLLRFALTFFLAPGPPTQRQASQEVERYMSEFDSKFGAVHPRFYHGTYREAVSHAKRHLRFLLVYLHHEDDPVSVQFAQDVVCTNLLKNIVEDNLLFWSCSVNKREGRCVAESLNKAKAPFIALLCFKEGQMRMIYKNQGHANIEDVINALTTSIVENEPNLNTQRRDRDRTSESTSSQLIMQEQDEAYQQSLLRDQERSRKKKEEEEVIRAIQENEEQKIREKEERIAARVALKEKLKASLPEQCKEDTLSLLFRLPNGSRLARRFSPHSTIKEIYDFVLACDESPIFFTLSSNFPKRVLPWEGEAHLKTSSEMGVQNSTTFFVQEQLSDDESSDEDSEAEV